MGFLTGDPSTQTSSSSSNSIYGNQAFNPLMTAFQPTMQAGGSASDMMASILGLNGSTGVQAPTYQPWNTGYATGPGSGVVGGNTQNFTRVAPQSTFTNTGKGPPVAGTPMNPQYNSMPSGGKGFNGHPIGQAGSSLSTLLPVDIGSYGGGGPTPGSITDYSGYGGSTDYGGGGYGGATGGYGGNGYGNLPVDVGPITSYDPGSITDYGTGSLPALPALDSGGNLNNPITDLGHGAAGGLSGYGTPGVGDYTIDPSAYPGTNLSDLVGGSLTSGHGTGDTVGGVGGPFGPGGGAPGTAGSGIPAPVPGSNNPGGGGGTSNPTPAPNPYTTPTATNAHDALNNFANSTGMQFVLNQGTNAVDQGMAGKGMALSGDTLKQLEQYGQGVGQTYLNQYMQNMNNMTGAASNSGRDLAIAGSGGTTSSSGTGSGTGAKPGLLGALGGGSGIGSLATGLAPFLL